MRQLLLFRHAKSSWDDPLLADFDRPLAPRGRKAAWRMRQVLRDLPLRPGLVLCSTSRRTRETWDLVAPGLAGVPITFEDDLYEASRADLLYRLRELDDHLTSVMLIGHNPGFVRLATALAGHNGDPEALGRLHEKFSTGALAVLDSDIAGWGQMEDGCCRLTEFIRPKDLSR